jgi:hypothetical protein
LERTNKETINRNIMINWISGWRLLIIFTAASALSPHHGNTYFEATHIAAIHVEIMTTVFSLSSYKL